MKRTAIIAATLLLAACAQVPDRDLTYAEAPPGEAPPPTSLTGKWTVMLLDGGDDDAGLSGEADGKRIWLTPACAGKALDYSIADNRIDMRPVPLGPVCRIGMPPQTDETLAALAQADTVESAPAGAIRLHGGGLVLLLVPRAP